MIFTELLNDHYREWREQIDFRYCKILKKNSQLDHLDLAFVEGAISSPTQANRLRKIRARCQKLVAVGACAITGLPAGQRNRFNEKIKQEIAPLLQRFRQQDEVQPLKAVVKVDAEVPGCPMDETVFLDILNTALLEFGITTTK